MEPGANLLFVGTAQPRWPPAEQPTYAGSMLRPVEKEHVVRLLSELGERGETACPLVIDHAGLKGPNEKLDPSKKIGHVTDLMVDEKSNVVAVGEIYGDRPEAHALFGSMRAGKNWGLSFFTDMETDAATGDVKRLRLSHLGVTTDPAWAQEGTWIHTYSDKREPFKRALRERYLSRPGWQVSDVTRRRYGLDSQGPPSVSAAPTAHTTASTRGALAAVSVGAGPLGAETSASALWPWPRQPGQSSLSPTPVTVAMADPAFAPPAAVAAAPVAQSPAQAPAAAPVAQQSPAAPAAQQAPAPVAQPPMSRASSRDLLQNFVQQAKTIAAMPDSLRKVERAKELEARVQEAHRAGHVTLNEIIRDLGGDMNALDEHVGRIQKAPLDVIEQMMRDGSIEPESAVFTRQVMQHPTPESRVFADYVQAMTAKWGKSQRDYELAMAESKRSAEEAAALKRTADERDALNIKLARQVEDYAQALKNMQASGAVSAPAAAAPAPAAAASTPAAVAAGAGGSSTAELARYQFLADGAYGNQKSFNELIGAMRNSVQYSPSTWIEPAHRGERRTPDFTYEFPTIGAQPPGR